MVISSEIKQEVERMHESHTLQQIAEKFKISKSSVSRIVKDIKATDSERREASGREGERAGGDTQEESKEEQNTGRFEFTPETEEREVLTLDAEGDQGISKLLAQHHTEDPLAVEVEDTIAVADEATAGAPSAAGRQPADEPPANIHVSDADMDSLLRSLMPEEKAPTRKKAPTRSRPNPSATRSPGTSVTMGAKAHVPMSIVLTQIKMYVAHMGEQLDIVIGRTEQERERFMKTLKMTMPREEAEGILCSIKGCLVIQQAVSGVESSIFVGAGCAQSLCPLVGMNLSSPVNLMAELDKQRQQIRMNATQMIIDDFSWYEGKCSAATSLGLLVMNSVFACDAQNRAMNARRPAVPVTDETADDAGPKVPLEMQEKYKCM